MNRAFFVCFLTLISAVSSNSAQPVGGSYFQGKQIATPTAPASGYNDFYFKSDNKPYCQNSGATETQILLSLDRSNLTDAGTDGITVTGGSNAVLGSGTSLSQHVSDSSHNGYLSSADWTTFNSKQSALTLGNLTDAGTDGITVTGGTGSVIGSGTSVAQHVADGSHNGYLSSSDWTNFNNAAGGGISALTGDVTATGPGSAAATLASSISGAKTFSTSLTSPAHISSTANPATAGTLRLAKTDLIEWRNNANGGNLPLSINGSDQLVYNSNRVFDLSQTLGSVNGGTGGDSSGATGLAKVSSGAWSYSQLTNSDVASSAAVATSKIALGTTTKTHSDSPYTITTSDALILGDTSAGTLTLTLPAATGSKVVYRVKYSDSNSSNAITVQRAGSDTITDLSSGLTSTTLNTQGEEIALVDSSSGVWIVFDRRVPYSLTSYSPSWTADSSNPAIGNGSITGQWARMGASARIKIYLKMGTTTTFGTGTYFFSTPFTIDTSRLLSTNSQNGQVLGISNGFISGTGSYIGSVEYGGTNTTVEINGYNTSNPWQSSVPGTWNANAATAISLDFEVPVSGWNP